MGVPVAIPVTHDGGTCQVFQDVCVLITPTSNGYPWWIHWLLCQVTRLEG